MRRMIWEWIVDADDWIAKLKIHATGKGNAKKPDMQAAVKERWGVELKEDEADAAWAEAFALDCNLFEEPRTS